MGLICQSAELKIGGLFRVLLVGPMLSQASLKVGDRSRMTDQSDDVCEGRTRPLPISKMKERGQEPRNTGNL